MRKALTKDFETFLRSNFGFTAADRAGRDAAVEIKAVGNTTSGFQDMDAFPLMWQELVTGTDSKVCTFSDLVGGTAAGEDIGAETSSIDPKVTAEARTEDEKMKKTGKRTRMTNLVLRRLRYFGGQ